MATTRARTSDRVFLTTMALAILVAYGWVYGVGAATMLSVVGALSCPLLGFLLLRRINTAANQRAVRPEPESGGSLAA